MLTFNTDPFLTNYGDETSTLIEKQYQKSLQNCILVLSIISTYNGNTHINSMLQQKKEERNGGLSYDIDIKQSCTPLKQKLCYLCPSYAHSNPYVG